MHSRRTVLRMVACFGALLPDGVNSADRSYRIGFFGGFERDKTGAADALVQGLNELGYIEGQNLSIEWRFAGGDMERLPILAAELVDLKLDVVLTGFVPAAKALQKANQSVPVVVIASHDGVGSGLYQSLAHPGGNLTAIDSLSDGLDAKRIEIMTQLVPNARRLTVLYNPGASGVSAHFRSIATGAARFRLTPTFIALTQSADLQRALGEVLHTQPDVLMSIQDPLLYVNRRYIVDFAMQRLPMANKGIDFVRLGQLFSYGASINAIYRRAASYVDKIFRGANPGDIPVEQPTTFELAINLRTAKSLGIDIPPSLLASADFLIE